jgi:hypothetical protein
MGGRKLLAALGVALGVLAGTARGGRADVFVLASGDEIEGTLVREDATTFFVDLGPGILAIGRAQVVSREAKPVRREAPGRPAPAPETARAAAPPPPAGPPAAAPPTPTAARRTEEETPVALARVRELLAALPGTHPDRRTALTAEVTALGPHAVTALVEGLGARHWLVRVTAAAAIEQIAREGGAARLSAAIAPLVRNLRDRMHTPRWAANRALEAITGLRFGYEDGVDDEFTPEQLDAIGRWEAWSLAREPDPAGEESRR